MNPAELRDTFGIQEKRKQQRTQERKCSGVRARWEESDRKGATLRMTRAQLFLHCDERGRVRGEVCVCLGQQVEDILPDLLSCPRSGSRRHHS